MAAKEHPRPRPSVSRLRAIVTPTHRWLNASAVDGLERDLAELQRLFDDAPFPVHLVGGLAMAVRAGRFYRNHRDLDVAVFADDLCELADHLERRGLVLGRQRAYSHGSPSFRLQLVEELDRSALRHLDPEAIKLRAFPSGPRRVRAASTRTAYIDVFLLGRSDDGVVLHGYDATVPWDAWQPLSTVDQTGALLLPNVRYRAFLSPRSAKQRLDLQLAGIAPAPHGPVVTPSIA